MNFGKAHEIILAKFSLYLAPFHTPKLEGGMAGNKNTCPNGYNRLWANLPLIKIVFYKNYFTAQQIAAFSLPNINTNQIIKAQVQ